MFSAALKIIDDLVKSGDGSNVLLVFDDLLTHNFKEKKVFDLAKQPFAPVNIMNEIQARTGVFASHNLTCITLLDTGSTQLMFSQDELSLEKNLDSLVDQCITFNTDDCNLTKPFVPQLNLRTATSPIDYWQSHFLRMSTSTSFKAVMEQINQAQAAHFARKQFRLAEDPWDNYMFHDSLKLIPLICHSSPLNIYEQVIVAKFIEETLRTETISQYKVQGTDIIKELLEFSSQFGAENVDEEEDILPSDDEEGKPQDSDKSPLLETRIRRALNNDNVSQEEQEALVSDMDRMLKMFFLEMRVKGMLTEYKNDYFM